MTSFDILVCIAFDDLLLAQMDKRNLGQKTMMQEIKDVAERRRSDDQNIYLSTTNFATRLTPDLVFDDRHE